jgi:opacity protein-like surface antigen
MAAAVALASASQVHAQEIAAGPGVVEVTVIPGGAQFFVEGKDTKGPSFANYGLGAAVAVNFNRYIGVEGEVSGALGVTQDLQFASVTANAKTPNLLNYTGNLVISAANHSGFTPYATGGIGGLTLFDRSTLGITNNTTFLTGNVGGGLKWYSRNGRWGLRGDYRFQTVRSDDHAPAFFGQETRYGHRIYGGVLINAVR